MSVELVEREESKLSERNEHDHVPCDDSSSIGSVSVVERE